MAWQDFMKHSDPDDGGVRGRPPETSRRAGRVTRCALPTRTTVTALAAIALIALAVWFALGRGADGAAPGQDSSRRAIHALPPPR